VEKQVITTINMSILVTGATGSVGRAVVDILVEKGVPLVASARNPEKIFGAEKVPNGVTLVAADLADPSSLQGALSGIKKVFLYAQPETIDNFVKVAKQSGVEHVVVLSSAWTLLEGPNKNAIKDRHLIVERALQNSGLKWTFVRPDVFSSNASHHWAKQIKNNQPVKLAYPEAHGAPIHERDIAEVVVVALTTSKLDGASPRITGPESLSFTQQLKTISEAIHKPIPIEKITPEEAREIISQFLPPAVADGLLAVFKVHDGVPEFVSDEVEKITGHRARTFAEWVKDHTADFL